MTTDTISITSLVVGLTGVLLMCGAWAPLGVALAIVGWGGAIAGLVVRRDK